jgi:hypothetical protein
MEDLYRIELIHKWMNYKVTNKASMLRKAKIIRQSPVNNSMIIKKHNHRKLHRKYIEKKASTGFYKGEETED